MVPSHAMHTVLWRAADATSFERAVLAADPAGFHLAGTTLAAVAGDPVEIRYSILTDPAWRTRVVGVHFQAASGNRRLALRGDGEGNWTSGDEARPEFAGAVDVDLAFTPATNTLPIRRLDLDVGETAQITVLRVDAVAREMALVGQRYTRLDADHYRYEAGEFAADLTVDQEGMVVDYPGHFSAIAGAQPGVASTA